MFRSQIGVMLVIHFTSLCSDLELLVSELCFSGPGNNLCLLLGDLPQTPFRRFGKHVAS